MNETNLALREATPDDYEDILIWRNDPASLKMFKTKKSNQCSIGSGLRIP